MLIQFWERLCGYHKWTPVKAIVQSSTLARVGMGSTVEGKEANGQIVIGWESHCEIVWKDQQGVEQTAVFEAPEESPLYQLCDDDTVDIRFNPKHPANCYIPGLLQAKLVSAWKFGLFAMMMVLACIIVIVTWLGPNVLFRTIFH
ncbi:MAG TPA: hypothetical protein VHD85_11205 [Terracidiphilus sp.]|nr:hypothetical protein [Terracidiphilus sp.]